GAGRRLRSTQRVGQGARQPAFDQFEEQSLGFDRQNDTVRGIFRIKDKCKSGTLTDCYDSAAIKCVT
ncbi:MAG TPA: hypothetical protein VGH13_11785, partial [Xanthobacteraceae bacterium]